MIGRLLSTLCTTVAVWRETKVWVDYLTGEGPATVQRQRKAAEAARAADPPGPPLPRRPPLGRPRPRRGGDRARPQGGHLSPSVWPRSPFSAARI